MTNLNTVPQPPVRWNPRVVAIHEAGHVVVSRTAGARLRLVAVSIVPDKAEGSLGHAKHAKLPRVRDWELGDDGQKHRVLRDYTPEDDPDPWERRHRLEPIIMGLYGGVIAQKRAIRKYDWIGADHDLRSAAYLLDQMHLSSARTENRYSDYLRAATGDIVDQEWATIEALAAELQARGTLTGRDVVAFWQSQRDAKLAAFELQLEQYRQHRD